MKRYFTVTTFFLFFLVLAVLSSCGKDAILIQNSDTSLFNGQFYLSGSSTNCITLSEITPGIVDLLSDCQNLTTENPENGTFGEFPRITRNNMLVINNEIRFTTYLTFDGADDIEEDVSGSNISGRKKVDVLIAINENNNLELTIEVWDGDTNINEVVATRKFTQIE
jgi:hypothetical protein